MAKTFQMVRVETHVWLKLQAFKEMLDRDQERKGMDALEATDRFGVSLSTAIEELIRRDNDHKARSVKAAKERVLKKLAELEELKAD